MIPPFDELATDGVVTLRALRAADVPAIVESCRDAETVRWTRVPHPYDESDARDFLAQSERRREAGQAVTTAIVDAAAGDYLGGIDLHVVEEDGRAHIGYAVAPWARRRGVAVRAVNLMTAHGFEVLGLGRIEIVTHPENLISQRVAERAGFVREAVLRSYLLHRGQRHDGVMFSRLSGTR